MFPTPEDNGGADAVEAFASAVADSEAAAAAAAAGQGEAATGSGPSCGRVSVKRAGLACPLL